MLASGRVLEEQISFPGDANFKYLLATTVAEVPDALYEGGEIRVSIPLKQVRNWASGSEIGIYFELPAKGNVLKVAIEKDLECVDGPPEEADPKAFPRASGKAC